jgi:aminoglycoside phosphotransferase (APT) family kinase protein
LKKYKTNDINNLRYIMAIIIDSKLEIAKKILDREFNIIPTEIRRFTNGYCHSVYYIKKNNDEFVLRITNEENKKYYDGSIKWLSELLGIGIPVPKIIKNGQFEKDYFAAISFIEGKDLGEIYHTLKDVQKHGIARKLSEIQIKVKDLPNNGLYGYPHSGSNESYRSWVEYLNSYIKRSFDRIKNNGIFNVNVCEQTKEIMYKFNDYFQNVKPTAFLDDITTKNVLIYNGKLSGIVDIDELCFGDSLLVVGLTNMALLSMKMDTKYIDYWLDEVKAGKTQRKIVKFYTLLYCIDFMGEQGMRFNNGNL